MRLVQDRIGLASDAFFDFQSTGRPFAWTPDRVRGNVLGEVSGVRL